MKSPPTYEQLLARRAERLGVAGGMKIKIAVSGEHLEMARNVATRVTLDATDTVEYWAGSARHEETHRLGDYFSSVEIENAAAGFDLIFTLLPHAEKFWKDLIVRICKRLETTGAEVTL